MLLVSLEQELTSFPFAKKLFELRNQHFFSGKQHQMMLSWLKDWQIGRSPTSPVHTVHTCATWPGRAGGKAQGQLQGTRLSRSLSWGLREHVCEFRFGGSYWP